MKVEMTDKLYQVRGPRPQLKIIIPKDASQSDGDALENGIFLSASERVKIHATYSEFPTLAQMAQDYLPSPATIKRVFSKSRHICSIVQSSLKEKTLVTKAWIRSGFFDMVPKQARMRRKYSDNRKK